MKNPFYNCRAYVKRVYIKLLNFLLFNKFHKYWLQILEAARQSGQFSSFSCKNALWKHMCIFLLSYCYICMDISHGTSTFAEWWQNYGNNLNFLISILKIFILSDITGSIENILDIVQRGRDYGAHMTEWDMFIKTPT